MTRVILLCMQLTKVIKNRLECSIADKFFNLISVSLVLYCWFIGRQGQDVQFTMIHLGINVDKKFNEEHLDQVFYT